MVQKFEKSALQEFFAGADDSPYEGNNDYKYMRQLYTQFFCAFFKAFQIFCCYNVLLLQPVLLKISLKRRSI